MEGQKAKRKRVYSVEPNKVVQAKFTRSYMNYLAPALKKINERRSSIEEDKKVESDVKYEVDMAMVISSQGFAWSNALKSKLQKNGDEDSKVDMARVISKQDCKEILVEEKNEDEDEDEDEEVVDEQLRCLRKLLPGGEEIMSDDEMVSELESYVSCLQMQVNILKCLTDY